MPGGMSGTELAQQLRRQKPDLKVIVASGYNRRGGDAVDPFGAGIEHLAKPFDVTTLTQTIRRVLDGDAEK